MGKKRGSWQRRQKQSMGLFSGMRSDADKHRSSLPGGDKQQRTKRSNYCEQFLEKQKLKRSYGVREKQLRNTYNRASGEEGPTGLNLLTLVERRMDNVVYLLGFAHTRNMARQLVSHGAIRYNGQKVNIPSQLVNVGDEISVAERAKKQQRIEEAQHLAENRPSVEWLEVNSKEKTGTVKRLPERDDMSSSINEQLIVELYSK